MNDSPALEDANVCEMINCPSCGELFFNIDGCPNGCEVEVNIEIYKS